MTVRTAESLKIEQLSEDDVIVVVMGPSGAGKSSFINMATGSHEPISDVKSCTREIRIVKFHSPDKSKPDIVLIDTPGFTHDHMTDVEVLNVIAGCLWVNYKRKIKLTGILYLHKIPDSLSGTHRRNVNMFGKLCGKDALQNVIFATTMWANPNDSWELKQEERFKDGLKGILGQETTVLRYHNTRATAWDIIDRFQQTAHRCIVRLQQEIVDMRRQLHETEAGQSWNIRPPKIEGLSEKDAIIAIMGPTGAGKSSFINTATGSTEAVDDVQSCTRRIAISRFHTPGGNRPDVVLVDTPGFNHEHMTNAEVLSVIAEWLCAIYEYNIKLTGILYLHKVSDPLSQTHSKNVDMFGKLCGAEALQNVITVTTTWTKPDNEWELVQEEGFKTSWREILGQETLTFRYHHTRDSAWDILDRLLQNKHRYAVRLQKEIGDAARQLHETAAGRSWSIQRHSSSRFTLAAMVELILNLLNVKNLKPNSAWESLPSRLMDPVPRIVDTTDLSSDDIIIALIGLTGTGKSSFIKMASGNDSVIGHSLESCTQEIGMVKVQDVVLVDTPGFDDTEKSDREILTMIADWLGVTYKRDIKLAGILYLHRISDNRVAGTPLKNMQLFEKLCGNNALQNVVLTTTMWDKVDGKIGIQREKELKSGYWKGMITQGSRTVRYRNTRESAWDILDGVLGHNHLAVLLQKEMVDMEKQLRETQAGRKLYDTLETLMTAQQEKLDEIRVETMRQTKDEAALKQLQEEQEELQKQLQTTIFEMQQLKISVGKRFLRYFSSSK